MKIVLDTNIFIFGFMGLSERTETPETMILKDLLQKEKTLLLSRELEEQLLRVFIRVKDKNFAGLVRHLLWSDYLIEFVTTEKNDYPKKYKEIIPRKDLGIFLTAYTGDADFLITNDLPFLEKAKQSSPGFRCMTAEEFVDEFL